MVLAVLIGWVLLSLPLALLVGAMFKAGAASAERPSRVAPALVPVRVTGPAVRPGVRH